MHSRTVNVSLSAHRADTIGKGLRETARAGLRLVAAAMPCAVGGEALGGMTVRTYIEGVYSALCLRRVESCKFKQSKSWTEATVDAHGCDVFTACMVKVRIYCVRMGAVILTDPIYGVHYIVSAWALTLSVRL